MNTTRDCILKVLKNSSSKYLRLKNIQKKCGKEAKNILRKLIDEGLAVKKKKKYAKPERAGFIRGRFDAKKDGYGFLMPDSEIKDIFIPPDDTFTALDGDLVMAEKIKKERGRWVGRIVKILKREKEFFIGQIKKVDGQLMFEPSNRDIPYYFEIYGKPEYREGEWVMVKFLKWTTPHLAPLAEFVKKVNRDNLSENIIKNEFKLKKGFSDIVIDKSKQVNVEITGKREDFTELQSFTIDPEDAKDFDDAVSLKKEGKFYHLWVHIADVSRFIQKGTVLDKEAKNRGCTVYLPNETFFMLPEELTQKLSLREKEEKPTVTVYMKFDKSGNMREKKFYRSKIRSDRAFNYNQTQDIIEGKKNSPFSKNLKQMSELAEILSKKRHREGYLDFRTREVEIDFDNKEPASISLREELWSYEIIEQFMVSANEAVAAQIYSKGVPSIYRIHEEPDEEKLDQFMNFVRTLGFELASTEKEALSEFLENIRGSSFDRVLNYELLRCMKRARYIAQAEPHYGLGTPLYTHFTSPIRRYPDIITHRILFGEQYSSSELTEIANHSTEREWEADTAEREMQNLYILQFLEKNRWEEFRGIVTDVASDGVWVELNDFLITGFIPLNLLPPENFKATRHSLEGRRHKITIGDLLLVKIYSVVPITGELIFEYSGKVNKF